MDNPNEYFIHETYGPNGERIPKATREQLEAAFIPLQARDYCAHIFLPLAACWRAKGGWIPGACHHELHNYERCEWEEARRREAKRRERDARKKYGF